MSGAATVAIRDTAAIRADRHRLFLHWEPSVRDISQAHISRWIVQAVKSAYPEAGLAYGAHVTAHEVRAISTSWVYYNHVALPDVMAAAFWRSSGVFLHSYFRDLAASANGKFTLGPLVVSQHVIQPPWLDDWPSVLILYDLAQLHRSPSNEHYLLRSSRCSSLEGQGVALEVPPCRPRNQRCLVQDSEWS